LKLEEDDFPAPAAAQTSAANKDNPTHTTDANTEFVVTLAAFIILLQNTCSEIFCYPCSIK
jgi:hypothetical protein